MRAALSLLMVLLLAAPAAASPPSGAQETTPLSDLITEVEWEIARLESVPDIPLPGFAIASRYEARMMRADEFIGGVRARAHDRLHARIDEPMSGVIHFLDASDDLQSATTALEDAGITPVQVVQVRAFLAEWLELQDRIAHLREVVAPALPGRVCPVRGDTWFRDEWQYPRPGGRIHKGVDLATEFGQELQAVEDGVVVQANWHRLGGRQVWFRGDTTGDVYYYAHLEYWPTWLWTGTRLEAGDFIGLAGTSGNAHTPHLHFGWMPGSGDVDLDNLQNPYALMYELCR